MVNLIVCCDGTWNNMEQEDNGVPAPTNVVKLYNSLSKTDSSDTEQLKYYHPGLGGENTGVKDAIIDGALGKSIKRHICSAYYWLAENYSDGDKVYIFGFSRGAFTARSLGGLLGLGLLDFKDTLDDDIRWRKTHSHYDYYRTGSNPLPSQDYFANRNPLPIKFIGVWDTVGALGIPNDFEVLNLLDNPASWSFHDTELGDHIEIARHAMAMDEVRSSFSVTRWSGNLTTRNVQEKWFPGVHSDVGGGYADSALSDIALRWMLEEAHYAGLGLRSRVFKQLKPNPAGPLHNSYKGVFSKLRSRPRNVCEVTNTSQGDFHESVFTRQDISPIEHPQYWPTQKLDVGSSLTVDVFAKERWNPSCLYMELEEEYIFSSSGRWQDSKDSCDWNGTEDGNLTIGDIIRFGSSIWGLAEKKFKKLAQNKSTDFLFTKRIENMPWFIAVGCIANDSGVKDAVLNDGSPNPHQFFCLPNHSEVVSPLKVTAPGYFYTFANDVWALYSNNHGSIKLTIKRIK